jgi:hypothetical protein
MKAPITLVVEGATDEPVARRLIATIGGTAEVVYNQAGKHNLDRRIQGYNKAARHAPWLVLRDLDHDAGCPGELAARLLGQPSTGMCFRIAVRSVESWFLADTAGFADFFRVGIGRLPPLPDSLDYPKQLVVDLCRRSTSRTIREAVVPRAGSGRRVGPGYEDTVIEFARDHWNPVAAKDRSPSLEAALRRLSALAAAGWLALDPISE